MVYINAAIVLVDVVNRYTILAWLNEVTHCITIFHYMLAHLPIEATVHKFT
ncbi:hypothetical protein V12B01_13105 [Vibrio splendidus 12B01]|nr:hypothetical protein V12B01_13105 [Vibrio splendidus 12B01]